METGRQGCCKPSTTEPNPAPLRSVCNGSGHPDVAGGLKAGRRHLPQAALDGLGARWNVQTTPNRRLFQSSSTKFLRRLPREAIPEKVKKASDLGVGDVPATGYSPGRF